MKLEACPALVLNADYRPLSYLPLSLISWQEAIKAVFLSRVQIVAEYDEEVSSPSVKVKIPSVISLNRYVHCDRHPAFTRFNVFLRDSFTCQYCESQFSAKDLTFDHIIPRSRGGITSWTNVITSCASCNLAKGSSTLQEAGMSPKKMPRVPKMSELQRVGRHYPPNFLHESWRDFLYWDSELEDT